MIEIETRTCACGCRLTFRVMKSSEQRFASRECQELNNGVSVPTAKPARKPWGTVPAERAPTQIASFGGRKLSARGIERELGVNRQTLYYWARTGKLKAYEDKRGAIYEIEAVKQLIAGAGPRLKILQPRPAISAPRPDFKDPNLHKVVDTPTKPLAPPAPTPAPATASKPTDERPTPDTDRLEVRINGVSVLLTRIAKVTIRTEDGRVLRWGDL